MALHYFWKEEKKFLGFFKEIFSFTNYQHLSTDFHGYISITAFLSAKTFVQRIKKLGAIESICEQICTQQIK